MANFLRLIDVNAGGLRLKKGQGILHLMFLAEEFWRFQACDSGNRALRGWRFCAGLGGFFFEASSGKTFIRAWEQGEAQKVFLAILWGF